MSGRTEEQDLYMDDEKKAKKSADLLKKLEDQMSADIKFIMNSRHGRRFMYENFYAPFEGRETYDPNAANQSYKNGKRSVCEMIKTKLKAADKNAYLLMINEGLNEEQKS